ncbi:hypothetical protein ACH9L7_18160 (plasmid) [Haloferax sp. S1W]|uniref:hypothetical protein n=1 Tax=Haloferax sp. S1W TaxID=3377110 RepID=UPI0037C5341C
MTTAGCSSVTGGDDGDTTTDAVTTEVPETTDTVTSNETATSNETSHNDTATNETASDGHSHSHGNESTSEASNSSDIDAAYTGQMAVMVAGERVSLAEAYGSDSTLTMSDKDTWHTNETTTLATALSEAGVEANESTLSYAGKTYDASENGTKISYRVDSHEVDPEEYTLESDDKVWVLVVSNDSNVTTPGEYIPPENLHVHGTIEFTVDGDELDFSRDKYQQAGHNDHFHFEGGHADPWHAHSAHVTLGYAMSTLDGINMTDEAIVYNGVRYPYSGENGTVTVTVNGEPVAPNDYYLKNGDSVRIVIEPSD